MKSLRKILILYITTAFFVSCSEKTNEKTSDEKISEAKEINTPVNTTLENLSASWLMALKENNFSEIEDFLPLKEDVENILTVYTGTDKEKKEILADAENNVKKIRENSRKAFNEILKKGKEVGINWNDVTFTKAEYTLKKENNIEMADLLILFTYKTLIYKIQIEECIKTEKGWLIFDKPTWKG